MLQLVPKSKAVPFVNRGADVNAKDYKGMTPLRLARRYGQDDIEEMLIAKGGRDEVDPPTAKKISTGVEPPWVTRKVSRRDGLVTCGQK